MSRSLARRGASVLVAAALLGGGMTLGGGTASAAEIFGSVSAPDRVILDLPAALVLTLGQAAGSVGPLDGMCFYPGAGPRCPSNTELLLDLLLGNESS